MAGPSHADLTGADLHEPKGADSAAADTLYAANGSGSGTWRKVTSASVDSSSIKNVNKFILTASMVDIGTASSIYVPIPVDCTLNKVVSCIQGSLSTTDAVITVANYAGTTIGTITISQSGSAAGDRDLLSAASNNTFLADTYIKLSSDGGPSNTVEAKFILEFTYG